MDRVVAVTPAGRRGYLELLAHYVLADEFISEWHLWDNCRAESDRVYINDLAAHHKKIKVITLPKVSGWNNSINQFYKLCNDRETFYIKMDDDIVYLPPEFGKKLLEQALPERAVSLWSSPMVVNNAICSWMLKYLSKVKIEAELTAQAACRIGWRSAAFAESLHDAFLKTLGEGAGHRFHTPDQIVSLSRFSINCIGFFGSDVLRLGKDFCPDGVDDEEWLSVVLPMRLNRPGRIIGGLTVAHFSYWTQEAELLSSDILDRYYLHAGLKLNSRPIKKANSRERLKTHLLNRLLGPPFPCRIT